MYYLLSERVWFEINGHIKHGTIIAYASGPKDYKIRVDGTGDVVELYAGQIKGSLEEALVMPDSMVTPPVAGIKPSGVYRCLEGSIALP